MYNYISFISINKLYVYYNKYDQLKYWKGQKKSVDWITPNGVIYPFFRHLTLHQFKPFSRNRVWTHKTRFGLGMCERIGIKEKYDNLLQG